MVFKMQNRIFPILYRKIPALSTMFCDSGDIIFQTVDVKCIELFFFHGRL
jgi:hypothetical protein